jgi:phage terminase small subunit
MGAATTIGKLRPKQARFVSEYLKDCNGTQAAIRAGYSPKTAASQASDLLRNPKVAAAISGKTSRLEEEDWLQVRDLERALHRIIHFDPAKMVDQDGNALPLNQVPEETRLAVAGIDSEELWEGRGRDACQTGIVRKWKTYDKVAAIQLAMKRRGLLIEKHELTGPMAVTVNIGVRAKRAPGPRAA